MGKKKAKVHQDARMLATPAIVALGILVTVASFMVARLRGAADLPVHIEQAAGAPHSRGGLSLRTVTLGIDVPNVEALLNLAEPCLVANLERAMHDELSKLWSPDVLLRSGLGSAVLGVRLTQGANHTRVMRYSKRANQKGAHGGPFLDERLGIEWPRHLYDAWDMVGGHSLHTVLDPPAGTSASFSTQIDALEAVHRSGVLAARRLEHAICHQWDPMGCATELDVSRLVWLASAGLGQALHLDAYSNLFFHLHGEKEVVLVPPAQMVDAAHLFPAVHPASRQSQLAWDSAHAARRVQGYSTIIGTDHGRPPPTYNGSLERHVVLRAGDVLFIPSHWGHQTFTSLDGPSASYALWLFPHTSPRGVRPTPKQLRGGQYDEAKTAAAKRVLKSGVTSPAQAWAALRELGRAVAAQLVVGGHAGSELFRGWAAQRWRPQYGGLGVDIDRPLPWTVVCARVPSPETVEDTARQLAGYVRELSQWSPRPYRDVVLRHEAQDVLDWLVTRMPTLTGLAEELHDADQHGVPSAEVSSAAQSLSFLVRSFAECSEQDGTIER